MYASFQMYTIKATSSGNARVRSSSRAFPINIKSPIEFARRTIAERRRSLMANPGIGRVSLEVLQCSSLKLEWNRATTYHLTEIDRIIAQKDAKPDHFCAGCKVVHSSSICGQKQIEIVCSDSQFNGAFSQREPEHHDSKHLE